MRTKTILIVDDDDHLLELLAFRCERIGLKVFTAHNALTALKILDDYRINLLCLDVNMPTGNGLSMCEMLVSAPESVHYPIIILTGRKDPETIRRCHNMCVYYVAKCPNLWDRLQPVIYELIDIPASESPAAHDEPKRQTNPRPSTVSTSTAPIDPELDS